MSTRKPSAGSNKKKSKNDDTKVKEKTIVEQLNDKLAIALNEIETLGRELAHRDDTVSRLKQNNNELKVTVNELQVQLDDRNKDRHDYALDSNNQYRQLQMEMQSKLQLLECQVNEYKLKNDSLSEQLNQQIHENKKMVEIKDAIIEEQSTKIACMASEFESMLNDTMDKVARKIQMASDQWNSDVTLSPDTKRKYSQLSN